MIGFRVRLSSEQTGALLDLLFRAVCVLWPLVLIAGVWWLLRCRKRLREEQETRIHLSAARYESGSMRAAREMEQQARFKAHMEEQRADREER